MRVIFSSSFFTFHRHQLVFMCCPVSSQVFLCVLDKTGNQQEESLEDALEYVNDNIENLNLLTDFPMGTFLWLLLTVNLSLNDAQLNQFGTMCFHCLCRVSMSG